MNAHLNNKDMVQLAEKLGVSMSTGMDGLASIHVHEMRVIDLLPEMMMMVRSLVAGEEVVFRREPITAIQSGLLISFQNIFHHQPGQAENAAGRWNGESPYVRVVPLHLKSEVRFPKGASIRQITVLVEADYLKNFLGKAHQQFEYLFDAESTFCIEEFMSPEIAVLLDEVINMKPEAGLQDFYYRLKCLELIYLLFKNLSQRAPVAQQRMSPVEIDAIYRVRNAMALSLDKALPMVRLVTLSGMNELKLRRLFTQVFGKGLYPYFQHLRMQEAARLLRDDKLSVSEAGYRLGFSNLSHFGQLFEEHMGVKPKKWSSRI